jgi:hypothetical protein
VVLRQRRHTHAFDRLLGAVPPALLALPVAERVVVGDLPDRRLRDPRSRQLGTFIQEEIWPSGDAG